MGGTLATGRVSRDLARPQSTVSARRPSLVVRERRLGLNGPAPNCYERLNARARAC